MRLLFFCVFRRRLQLFREILMQFLEEIYKILLEFLQFGFYFLQGIEDVLYERRKLRVRS